MGKPIIVKIRKDKKCRRNKMGVIRHKPSLVAYCPRCGNIITRITSVRNCEWCYESLDWSNRARGRFAGYRYIEEMDKKTRERYLV